MKITMKQAGEGLSIKGAFEDFVGRAEPLYSSCKKPAMFENIAGFIFF